MSSDDDLNSFEDGPKAKGRVPTRKRQRSASPGPSTTTKKPPSKAKAAPIAVDDDDEIMAIDPPDHKKSQKPPSVNGVKNAAKGKKKAAPNAEVPQVADEASEEDAPRKPSKHINGIADTSKAKPRNGAHTAKEPTQAKELIELAHLRDRERELTKDLEKVLSIRDTEAESLLQQMQERYDAQLKIQEDLIKELTSQLARVDHLTKTGQTAAVQFLTREAADEEKRGAEEEVTRLREVIKQKDRMLVEKDKKIAELEESALQIRRELDTEIAHSKALQANNNRAATASSATANPRKVYGTDDPKNAAVIKLYEEITNLLVVNVKHEPNQDPTVQTPDTVFTLIYTWQESARDDEDEEITMQKSINFMLRLYYGPPDSEPGEENQSSESEDRARYTPLHLDQESQIFVERLEFLSGSFTFPASQHALFFNTLAEKVGNAYKAEKGIPVQQPEVVDLVDDDD